MKRLLNSLIIVLVLFIGISFGINVTAATGDAYNIVTCPGEDMATQMQINWQSPTTKTNLKVQYTVASDTAFANAKTVDGTYRSFSRQNGDPVSSATYSGFDKPRHIWNVLLNNLTPNTKYIYRIVEGTTVLSTVYAFETASTTEDDFSFLFMTDPQYYNETGASKFNILAETHIQNDNVKFALITGDISDKGGNSSYWDMFYTKSSLTKIPYITTVGNHEYYDSGTVTTDNFVYNQYFYNPQNGPEHVKGSSYYFVYNGCLFIMLDSEERAHEEEQKEWFKNVCTTVDCSYIIVGCHKSSYPAGPYVSDGKLFIQKWGSVFDECQVDLVLSGHDHVYTRTKSVYNNEVTNEKYKGTVYIEGGSAGTKYYGKQSDENASKWECIFEQTTVGTVITVGKNAIKIQAYAIGSVSNGSYTRGTLKDEAYIQRRRFGDVAPTFSKEEFEKSIKVENAMPDMTSGSVSWSETGYGYVRAITCTNLNSKQQLGTVSFINNLSTKLDIKGKLWVGEVNKIKVDILYKDGTTSTLEIDFDNTVEWGEIKGAEAIEVTSSTFKLLVKVALNKDVDYIDKIRVLEDGKIRKNFNMKSEHLSLEEIIIDMNAKIMDPDTTHTYEIQALNVNGTVIWSQELVVTSLRELTEEDIYQNEMANIAFMTMIENLLAALGK